MGARLAGARLAGSPRQAAQSNQRPVSPHTLPSEKENKMATSIQHDLVSEVEHEINCPICFEDFEEPKCLPNCAHNVCQQCLQGMEKKRNNVLECPVCRVESVIPKGGVAAFPKNHLLVRLIEQSPGRKEKRYLKEAVKRCKEKLQGAKDSLTEMEKRYVNSKTKRDEMKQRIQSLVEGVVKTAREQEQKMLDEINSRYDQDEGIYETLQSSAMELCENATECIETVQGIIQNGELKDLKDLKDALAEQVNDLSECLEMRMLEANGEFTQPFDISLSNTDLAEKFIDEEFSLGKLSINSFKSTDLAETPQHFWTAWVPSGWAVTEVNPVPAVVSGVEECPSSGSLIQRIDSFSCGKEDFEPFSVAASRHSGDFAVLDRENKHVHIFNEDGAIMNSFRVRYGDLFDIAFSSEDEIVVVNRERNRLLHYDYGGNFHKKVMSASKENVKYTSLTVDVHGRYIISSRPYYSHEYQGEALPCILVYSSSGNLTLSFGEDELVSPKRAVFLNGKFYVADSEREEVLVFDKSGSLVDTLGDYELGMPSGITADRNNRHLLVSDTSNSGVLVYNQSGDILDSFDTGEEPIQIAVTKFRENLLVCTGLSILVLAHSCQQ